MDALTLIQATVEQVGYANTLDLVQKASRLLPGFRRTVLPARGEYPETIKISWPDYPIFMTYVPEWEDNDVEWETKEYATSFNVCLTSGDVLIHDSLEHEDRGSSSRLEFFLKWLKSAVHTKESALTHKELAFKCTCSASPVTAITYKHLFELLGLPVQVTQHFSFPKKFNFWVANLAYNLGFQEFVVRSGVGVKSRHRHGDNLASVDHESSWYVIEYSKDNKSVRASVKNRGARYTVDFSVRATAQERLNPNNVHGIRDHNDFAQDAVEDDSEELPSTDAVQQWVLDKYHATKHLITATVEPGNHTLEAMGFKRKNRPGEDSYEWGRFNPNGASVSVLFVNTSLHAPDNPPDFHYSLLGSDYRAPRLGPGGPIVFLKTLKSLMIQAAKDSPTWAEFRDTVRSKHSLNHYESLSNRLCEDFWTHYHGNNVVATVESGSNKIVDHRDPAGFQWGQTYEVPVKSDYFGSRLICHTKSMAGCAADFVFKTPDNDEVATLTLGRTAVYPHDFPKITRNMRDQDYVKVVWLRHCKIQLKQLEHELSGAAGRGPHAADYREAIEALRKEIQ